MNASEEEVVFHNQIGQALSQWAYIEGQLQRIVLECVQPPSRPVLAAAYLSIESFYGKLRFCDNLVVAAFFQIPAHIQQWKASFEKADRLASKRNQIAHGYKGLYIHNEIGRRWALVDQRPVDGRIPHLNGLKPPNGSLCMVDIALITEEFRLLTRQLCEVYELLAGSGVTLPETPADDRPTIRILRNQIRAALALPRLPSRSKSRGEAQDERGA